jgi:hypothetical protein
MKRNLITILSLLVVMVLMLNTTGAYAQSLPQSCAKANPSPTITIIVYNQAQAPDAILVEAEREAARILSQAGVRISWLDCSVGHFDAVSQDTCQKGWGPTNIGLRVVAKPTGRLQDACFGFATIPALATVYYDYKARFGGDSAGLKLSTLLGCTIAHELGHLLLGPGSHSNQGVMQAEWRERQIRQALIGNLLFTHAQSRLIQAEARRRMSQGWPGLESRASLIPQSAGFTLPSSKLERELQVASGPAHAGEEVVIAVK